MPIPRKKLPEKPKTARERIFLEVREWIVDGTLEPGEKLSDQDVSQYFSVSRTPVREAFQMLADQRLVTVRAGKETRVAPLNMEEAAYNYKMMAELQALAVEFAFPHISEETLDAMRRADALFVKAKEKHNIREAEIYDQQLHSILIGLSGSHFISEFTEILLSHIQRFEHLYYLKKGTDRINSHQELIGALRAGNLEAAKAAMRINWLYTLHTLEEPS